MSESKIILILTAVCLVGKGGVHGGGLEPVPAAYR